MWEARFPERNGLGLVLPLTDLPDDADERTRLVVGKNAEELDDDPHHLYWPYNFWQELGGRYAEFQGHPLTRMLVPRKRHVQEHAYYDSSVVRQPDELVPQSMVIDSYLEEAHEFDLFRDYVDRIINMRNGLRKGLYPSREYFEQLRSERIAVASDMAIALLMQPTEIIPQGLMEQAVSRTVHLVGIGLPASLIAAA